MTPAARLAVQLAPDVRRALKLKRGLGSWLFWNVAAGLILWIVQVVLEFLVERHYRARLAGALGDVAVAELLEDIDPCQFLPEVRAVLGSGLR